MKRTTKRLVIIAVYFLIVFGIIFLVWWGNRPAQSCFDGKQNQNESGIDCGGVCGACPEIIRAQDIEIQDVHVVYGGVRKYDVVAKVYNPNPLYGAATLPYKITLEDRQGNVIVQKEDSTFILPTEERNIVMLNIEADTAPAKAQIALGDVEWVKFVDYEDPDFTVEGTKFGTVKNSTNYAEVFGIIHNNSAFDFTKVRAHIILLDERKKPIAVNTTEVGAFNAFDQRDFVIGWPYKFPGEIKDVEIEVETNVFDSQNYTEQYLPGGRFEQLEPESAF
jgi:hypothetical protein